MATSLWMVLFGLASGPRWHGKGRVRNTEEPEKASTLGTTRHGEYVTPMDVYGRKRYK